MSDSVCFDPLGYTFVAMPLSALLSPQQAPPFLDLILSLVPLPCICSLPNLAMV